MRNSLHLVHFDYLNIVSAQSMNIFHSHFIFHMRISSFSLLTLWLIYAFDLVVINFCIWSCCDQFSSFDFVLINFLLLIVFIHCIMHYSPSFSSYPSSIQHASTPRTKSSTWSWFHILHSSEWKSKFCKCHSKAWWCQLDAMGLIHETCFGSQEQAKICWWIHISSWWIWSQICSMGTL